MSEVTERLRILVYGAGNIGSLYAALLTESGEDVSILARGRRVADIRDHGIRLRDVVSGKHTEVHVKVVERLHSDDEYDLVLVILPRNHVSEVLPILAANRQSRSVMFFGNNAAGPGEMIEVLGRDRVLLGFPGAAAVNDDQSIHYLILAAREQPTTIGELDGARSRRIQEIADAIGTAGFPVSICADMDAWLRTHAAEIIPTAGALYMAGVDPDRMARTRDALVLMLRAIREGYKVLSALGIPVIPRSRRVFRWLPEPLLLVLMRTMVESDNTRIKIGHAFGARDEMKTLADEFGELIREAGAPTPAIDILNRYLDPLTKSVPDGSSEIPLNWNGVWIVLGFVAAFTVLLSLAL
jgi:2-dehydropantoate 2-reductase